MASLVTVFGEQMNKECPLSEHPNPLMRRDHYLSLNGPWDFALDQKAERPSVFTKIITVPFAVETSLSGIQAQVHKNDFMHYRRTFSLPDGFLEGEVILHFDAVDQVCDVFLNGEKIIHHESGYFPFSYLIEHPLKDNVLEVTVIDDVTSPIYPRGKQAAVSTGIWYSPTSGIWQSVWLEAVPKNARVESLKIDSLFDQRKIKIHGTFTPSPFTASVEAYFRGRLVSRADFDHNGDAVLDFSYDFYPWSPEIPSLYELTVYYGDDCVHSYCALRKFSVIDNDGEKLFALNNKPYFLSAVLDQGYTPDGGLTFPSQKAMESDIALMKRCGFNSVRKHIKIEPLRWYAICDSQGLIVIQDFVNGGSRYSDFFIYIRPFLPFNISDTTHRYLGRALKESRDRFTLDLSSTVEKLYNVPSIAIWTIFNEGWGQFDTVSMTKRLRELDQTRLIDSASGWYDKKCGDIHSNHVYFFKPKLKNDHKRILALSECGGYSLGVNRHKFSKVDFGYKQFHSFDALNYQVEKLYRRQILRLVEKKGLSGVVFTQLTDVENETNGIVTYDRKVNKIDTGMLKRLNFFLYETFNKIHRDN